jgi:hypothetical protein
MSTWHIRNPEKIGHLAEGTNPPTRYSVLATGKQPTGIMGFTANKQGIHTKLPIKKGREIGMNTRNEMCRANSEEGTTGYAN